MVGNKRKGGIMDSSRRRYDIDWLRVLAMLMIFFFHSARMFNEDDWHIKNNVISFGATLFIDIVAQWIMPLFFILSAISSRYSLAHRDAGSYLKERFQRLVIPLLFGILVVIAPVQIWIERVSHQQYTGSFLSFYPHYFEGFYAFGGNFAWMGVHLWYLEMLFLFSLFTLPLFMFFKKEAVSARISQVLEHFSKPGMIYLFVIPVFCMELLVNLHPEGLGRRDFGGWSIFTYLTFFVLGYLFSFDSPLKPAIEKHRTVSLVLGVVFTITGAFLLINGYSSRSMGFTMMRSLNSWFWLFAFFGFAGRYLNFKNRFLTYGNTAVLPFYILHQTVIVCIGFVIASWNMAVMTKYVLLAVTSFVVIIAIYDQVVKRVGMLRFLFGMK
jgi:glucans biosynthesis protein C